MLSNTDLKDKTSNSNENEDRVDLSNIEILDSSKGDVIDFSATGYSQIHSVKCIDCGFKYEGVQLIDKCPRCGSKNIKDS